MSTTLAKFHLADLFPVSQIPIVNVIDVGAMVEGRNIYDPLVAQRLANVVGFEPDPRQHARLAALKTTGLTYIQAFIGIGRPGTLHRCRYNGCSSLYKPDPDVIDLFTNIGAAEPGGNFYVQEEIPVETIRLDDAPGLPRCDFLKVDVQGGELDVIVGAPRVLAETVVAQLEVEFVPLYKDQPLFAEVDQEMRNAGFLLHKLIDVNGRAFRPFMFSDDPNRTFGQLLWADAVYIRDFRASRQHTWSRDDLLKGALILHELYGSIDLAALLLTRASATLGEAYRQRLTAQS